VAITTAFRERFQVSTPQLADVLDPISARNRRREGHLQFNCREGRSVNYYEGESARQHHRNPRSNSESGIKGITYNDGPGTYSVGIYRDGRAKRVGTFHTLQDAKNAHQRALMLDNPDLHSAPAWRTLKAISPTR
jgi:hypothetical protein